MALIKQEPVANLVDQFIEESEDEERGPLMAWFTLIKKLAFGSIFRGFMTGIGVFVGSLVCHHYILPLIDMQYYSLFLIKLHKI